MTLDQIFGTKPKDSIFLPLQPYTVRFNCQSGQMAVSDTEFLGAEAEISIIKVARFFGTLGRTSNVEWLQLFYIPAPDCEALPQNTVCVSYLKTRSVSQFQQVVTRLLGEGTNPAEGIFKVGFQAHSNDYGSYYSVQFGWRKRKGSAEMRQLQMIADFVEGGPQLLDLNGTRRMVCIDGLDSAIAQRLMEQAQANPELEAVELMQRLALPEAR